MNLSLKETCDKKLNCYTFFQMYGFMQYLCHMKDMTKDQFLSRVKVVLHSSFSFS